jgi:hypothetical protein
MFIVPVTTGQDVPAQPQVTQVELSARASNGSARTAYSGWRLVAQAGTSGGSTSGGSTSPGATSGGMGTSGGTASPGSSSYGSPSSGTTNPGTTLWDEWNGGRSRVLWQ